MTPDEIYDDLQNQAENGANRPSHHANNAGEVFDLCRYLCADWTGDLRHTLWLQCDLRGCDFSKANLEGAIFYMCRLVGVELPSGVKQKNCELDDIRAIPQERKRSRLLRPAVAVLAWLIEILLG